MTAQQSTSKKVLSRLRDLSGKQAKVDSSDEEDGSEEVDARKEVLKGFRPSKMLDGLKGTGASVRKSLIYH